MIEKHEQVHINLNNSGNSNKQITFHINIKYNIYNLNIKYIQYKSNYYFNLYKCLLVKIKLIK